MTAPLVWLPFDPADLGDPPDGLRYEVVDPSREVPGSVADVAFHVPPYQLGSSDAPGLLITPHVGGATSAMWPRAHRLVRDQLHRFAAGEPLLNVVDR